MKENISIVIHRYTQEVVWGDQDSFGHVNHANIVKYFENARADFFTRRKIWDPKDKNPECGMVLTRLEMDYRRQIRYPDRLEILLFPGEHSSRKFIINCEMRSNSILMINARAELFWYSFKTQKSILLPESLKSVLS